MQGIVFEGGRKLSLTNFPDPTPGEGEVVLEMKASGMCGSDLKFYRAEGNETAALGLGALSGPVIAGHEPCGVIAALGRGVSGRDMRVGARVMVHHYHGCGACEHCRTGWAQMCPDKDAVYGITAHGGHAQYMKVPASTLVELPESLSFETGAAISCGTGTAYGALRRMKLSGHDTIAIFGQGPVGLSATQLAIAMGARVIALDISPERLARAREFGADLTINPQSDEPVAAIRAATHGRGAEMTLDTTGAAAGRLAAVQATAAWGTCCFVGEGGNVTIDVSNDMLRRQVTVIGSWTFSTTGQAECARFVAERKIDVDHLFTDRWQLAQGDEAYKLFDKQNTGKGVFLM